ncbi:hypothetical protein DR85_1955 [Francisella tularensis]|nr:hypothetical protein DR85_1955 [Francisella tularensis]
MVIMNLNAARASFINDDSKQKIIGSVHKKLKLY